MNYIKEMNALYDRQEQTPISGSAIALWSALMNINNKTKWKNTFTSPASVLQMKAGLTASSFKRARAELERVGYIEVESQGRGNAPIYTMHSLVVEAEEESVEEEVLGNRCFFMDGSHDRKAANQEEAAAVSEQVAASSNAGVNQAPIQQGNSEGVSVSFEQGTDEVDHVPDHLPTHQVNQEVNHVPNDHVSHHADHHPNQEADPLVKQYKTIQNQNKQNTSAADDAREQIFLETENNKPSEKPDAIMFYQENFGMAGPFVAESLIGWIHSLGEELVIEAMKRALERNKTTWSYVKSILNAWHKKGIRTVEQAKAEQVAFEQERNQKRKNHRAFFGVQEDIVPDWYEAEKERQRKELERKEVRSPEEEKRMREKVEEMLKDFSG